MIKSERKALKAVATVEGMLFFIFSLSNPNFIFALLCNLMNEYLHCRGGFRECGCEVKEDHCNWGSRSYVCHLKTEEI